MTTLPERLQDVLSAMREASPQCAGFADRIADLWPSVGGEVVDFQTLVALEVGADEENQHDILQHVRAWVASAKGQDLASPAQPSGFVLVEKWRAEASELVADEHPYPWQSQSALIKRRCADELHDLLTAAPSATNDAGGG